MTKGQSKYCLIYCFNYDKRVIKKKYCLISIKIHDKRAIKNKILFNMYFNSGQKGNQEQNTHDKRAIKNKILFNMYFNS